ncbi:MAG: hypothetical protein K2X98_01605 [Alphaproteobacteria bacterium]|nr:hypothetical protein [Alphaproteobacteria bacterium]
MGCFKKWSAYLIMLITAINVIEARDREEQPLDEVSCAKKLREWIEYDQIPSDNEINTIVQAADGMISSPQFCENDGPHYLDALRQKYGLPVKKTYRSHDTFFTINELIHGVGGLFTPRMVTGTLLLTCVVATVSEPLQCLANATTSDPATLEMIEAVAAIVMSVFTPNTLPTCTPPCVFYDPWKNLADNMYKIPYSAGAPNPFMQFDPTQALPWNRRRSCY